MKVFVSWSGKKSHAVAEVLHEWLPTVINSVEPWISSEGLRAGLKWNQQLEKELNGTSFGIIVATPRNQHAQWLNFEAGALSKKVGGAESRVAPLLIDFKKATDLVGPLASYQATMPTREGFHDLVASINEALGEDSRSVELLDRGFNVCWPALESKLAEVNDKYEDEADLVALPDPVVPRSPEDMLSEILETIRDMNRSDTRLKNAIDDRRISSISHNVSSAKSRKRGGRLGAVTEALESLGYSTMGAQQLLDGTTVIFLPQKMSDDEEGTVFDFLSNRDLVSGPVRFEYIDPSGPSNQRLRVPTDPTS
nr:TIR domain-containing protein [Paeniglutamicibacter terrestris]